ncbi:MAG: GH25 family lysozyme [Acutalibacter sp.]
MEDSQIAGADLVATCQTFCAAMEAAGLYAGIYASLSWLTTKLNSPQLDPYDKWVAQWNSACTYPKPYGIWQYTDRLAIGGQVFDGNWAYKDYPAIIQAMSSQQEGASLTEADVKKLARQEMEAYFAELAQKPVSPWAQAAVESVLARGLMRGDADGSFRPQSHHPPRGGGGAGKPLVNRERAVFAGSPFSICARAAGPGERRPGSAPLCTPAKPSPPKTGWGQCPPPWPCPAPQSGPAGTAGTSPPAR